MEVYKIRKIFGKKSKMKFPNFENWSNALWAEGCWKLKLTRVHATEYGIYVTKYLLV